MISFNEGEHDTLQHPNVAIDISESMTEYLSELSLFHTYPLSIENLSTTHKPPNAISSRRSIFSSLIIVRHRKYITPRDKYCTLLSAPWIRMLAHVSTSVF